jgi:C4-type Zn-finger protein
MRIRVYGKLIEPGGMLLEDETSNVSCPSCGAATATHRRWEACEGGAINCFQNTICTACGYAEGDLLDARIP